MSERKVIPRHQNWAGTYNKKKARAQNKSVLIVESLKWTDRPRKTEVQRAQQGRIAVVPTPTPAATPRPTLPSSLTPPTFLVSEIQSHVASRGLTHVPRDAAPHRFDKIPFDDQQHKNSRKIPSTAGPLAPSAITQDTFSQRSDAELKQGNNTTKLPQEIPTSKKSVNMPRVAPATTKTAAFPSAKIMVMKAVHRQLQLREAARRGKSTEAARIIVGGNDLTQLLEDKMDPQRIMDMIIPLMGQPKEISEARDTQLSDTDDAQDETEHTAKSLAHEKSFKN